MKLRRKITLSAIALAACATTAFTSTYAWYVTNTTAKVAFTGASTGQAESAGLLISTTGAVGSWDTKLTDIDLTGKSLTPLFYAFDSGIKFDTLAEGEDTGSGATDTLAGSAAVKTTGIVTFDIWLYSEGDMNVATTISVKNTTSATDAAAAAQTATVTTGAPSTVTTKGTKFTVNAFNAMYMAIQTKEAAVTDIYTDPASATTTAETPEILAFSSASTGAFVREADTAAAGTYKEGGNAHDYYDAAKEGHTLASAAKTNSALDTLATSQSTVALSAKKPTKITYTIWLEGSDPDCFNSCSGQTFNISFVFAKAGV